MLLRTICTNYISSYILQFLIARRDVTLNLRDLILIQTLEQSLLFADVLIFSLSAFRCISQSQAVKLFCNLPNKPSSLTARKMSSHSSKTTHSLVVSESCVMRGTVPSWQATLLLYHLLQKPPLLRPLHPAEKERQQPTVCGNPVEPQQSAIAHLTSRCASNLLISFRFESWVQESRCISSD